MVQKSSGLHASPPGLRALLTSPFSLSAFFALHSLLMNGYKFGWWENLVIHAYYLPATYTRVDPSLYPRDLFVNTMKQGIINSSYFWEGLAGLFRYFPVEPVTFIVYLAGLYCIFLALFYLSRTLFNSTLVSCGTLLLYSFGLRQFNVGSEAIYFNFLHSGIIGYPLSLLAIILFLKKRYAWGFFVCGLLFNVHSMYVTFLLFVFCTFFVVRFRSLTGKTVLTCFVSCLIPALPSLVFLIPQIRASYGGEAWLTGIRWTHWVHDFPSYWEPRQYGKPIIFMLLAAIAITRTRLHEIQRDALLLLPGVALMCILGTVFSGMIALPFIIKLQLWRCLWIFIIIGTIFISGFLLSCWREDVVSRFSIIATAIIMTGYSAYKNSMPPDFERIPAWILPVLGAYLFIYGRYRAHTCITGIARGCMALLLPVVTVAPFVSPLRESFFNIGTDLLLIFYCLILFLITLRFFENKFPEPDKRLKLYFYAFLVFLVTYDAGLLARQQGPHIAFPPATREAVHPWIDIQLFAKTHTPKDALFIIPPYMQGFRMFSERSTFGDWLDGMLINWTSEDFAVEWLKRMRSLGWTDVKGEWSCYYNLPTDGFLKVAREYQADYIVGDLRLRLNLPVIYKNDGYILYATKMRTAGQ